MTAPIEQRLRVALLAHSFPPTANGVATYFGHLADALVALGHEVHVIAPQQGELRPAFAARGGLTIHRVMPAREARVDASAPLTFTAVGPRRLLELHARLSFDVVECAESLGTSAALSALRTRDGAIPPVVLSLHAPWSVLAAINDRRRPEPSAIEDAAGLIPLLERVAVQAADGLSAPSRAYAERAADMFGLQVAPRVIRNPLPTPALVTPLDVGRVLYIGRLERGKGVDLLLDAWAALGSETNGWRLVLAGPGRVEGLSAARSVELLGRVSPERVAEELRRASALVLPSLWENYPYAATEAQANARPTLLTDGGGAQETLPLDLRRSLTIAAGDARALADGLRRLLAMSVHELRDVGDRLREHTRTLCDPLTIARQRVELYHDAIANQAHRTHAAHGPAWHSLWRSTMAASTATRSTRGVRLCAP